MLYSIFVFLYFLLALGNCLQNNGKMLASFYNGFYNS